ncbi:hypothetical protein [Lentzea sp. NPDC059081]|uniref:hypothetical protein n=1 Tax=Lentzea sp. NPDC059081 TaxID=3346719 RepID=UPI0036C3D44C
MDAISKYLDLVDEVMRRYPDQREGQAHYNALRMGWPHLEAQVLGTDRDCYGSDKALPRLLAWIDQVLPHEEQHPDVPA